MPQLIINFPYGLIHPQQLAAKIGIFLKQQGFEKRYDGTNQIRITGFICPDHERLCPAFRDLTQSSKIAQAVLGIELKDHSHPRSGSR